MNVLIRNLGGLIERNVGVKLIWSSFNVFHFLYYKLIKQVKGLSTKFAKRYVFGTAEKISSIKKG